MAAGRRVHNDSPASDGHPPACLSAPRSRVAEYDDSRAVGRSSAAAAERIAMVGSVAAPDFAAQSQTQALRDLACIVLGDTSLEAVLLRVTHVAKSAIPGADEVSVTMHVNTTPM